MLLLSLACASNPYDTAPLQALSEPALGVGTLAPGFELEDQNPTSATVGELLGPNRFLDRVSAWYFGHAT
jgi:hypothetical protein